ncbi:3957_t:CDS:2, partial [Racocetra fulgida]
MPMLHIVLGSPSTGKTALVREITRKKIKSKDQFSPLFINCRKGQFDTPDRVYDSIYSQFRLFFDKHKDFLKRIVEGQFSIGDVGYRLGERGATTSNDITRLLDNISAHLPNWSIWNGNNIPPPILVIDEANMFSQLAENDKNLLKSILNWLVVNTKEEKRFHTVLTSSDSFFFNWIVKLLHIPHATPYFVEDLSKEEAEKYFEMHILPQYGMSLLNLSIYTYCCSHNGVYYLKKECKELESKFDQVCKIIGTRMMIIEIYVNEYKNSEGKLAEAKDLIKTMDAIVNAEDQGYILEDVLNKEISEKKDGYFAKEYTNMNYQNDNNGANNLSVLINNINYERNVNNISVNERYQTQVILVQIKKFRHLDILLEDDDDYNNDKSPSQNES